MPDKIKDFYKAIEGSGIFKDEAEFRTQIKSNPKDVFTIFDSIEDTKGVFRDYNEFENSFDLKKKENPTASYGLGVSMASKGRPISQNLVEGAFNKTTPTQPIKPTVAKPKEKGSQILERTGSALSTLGKSFIDGVFATSSEQIAILSKKIDDEGRELIGMAPLNKPIEEYQTYKVAKQIMASTEEAFKPNPEFKGEIQEQVAQTAGDLLGLVATAFITKNPSSALSKLGTKGLIKAMGNTATRNVVMKEMAKGAVKMAASPTAFLGAAQTGTRNYDEAKAKGATDEEADAMYWSTAVTGAIANSLPIGGLLSRFDKASGGTMKQMVVGGVVGGIEEAVTEGIEQISTNFAAQNIYDETRKLFEGVGESTAMGGGLGFVLNVFGVKLGSIRNKYKDNPQKLAEIDDSVEYIKGIAEKEAQLSAIKLSKEEQVKVDKYTAIVNDPNADENVKDIAKEKIQEINGSKIIEAESVQERMNNLSEDDIIEVKLIDAEIEKTKTAISNSSDVEIRDELDRQLGILSAEKELILNSESGKVDNNQGASVQGRGITLQEPIAFDFDGTLMDNSTGKLTPLGEEVKERIANGEDISIVTARESNNIDEIKQSLGIEGGNVHATGDESLKGETLDSLNINRNNYFDADTQKLDNIRSGTSEAQSSPQLGDVQETGLVVQNKPSDNPPQENGGNNEIVKRETMGIGTPITQEGDGSGVVVVGGKQSLTDKEKQQLTEPEGVKKGVSKFENLVKSTKVGAYLLNKLTVGDLVAVRAKEKVDAEKGRTIDKAKSITTKLQTLLKGDKSGNLKGHANSVLSVSQLGDKVEKSIAITTPEAISIATDGKHSKEDIDGALQFAKGKVNGVSIPQKFETILNDIKGITQKRIDEIKESKSQEIKSIVGKIVNYETVGKSKPEAVPFMVKDASGKVLKGKQDVKVIEDTPVTLEDLRKQLEVIPKGKEILAIVDKSMAEAKKSRDVLSSSEIGKGILQQVERARQLIDEGSDYILNSKASGKIKDRIGETVAGNRGFYLKRVFKFWNQKDFKVDQAMKEQAIASVADDKLAIELTRLNKNENYNSLSEIEKQEYLKQRAEEIYVEAKRDIAIYLDQGRRLKEDKRPFLVNKKVEKVDAKLLKNKKQIDEAFLNLLGNDTDAISQFHETILAQTQVKAAADLHWQIKELGGDGSIYMSEGDVIDNNNETTKGYKQINDSNSLLDGMWVSDDIYDVIATSVNTIDSSVYTAYKTLLGWMRKSKTIYNFTAGWITNLTGGEISHMANGIVNNPKKIGKYLKNRGKYILNPEGLDSDTQANIDIMKDNGLWSTSIDAGMIKLLNESYNDLTDYSLSDKETSSVFDKFWRKAKQIDNNIVRNYSVIDDFTKLVFFTEKKDVFSRKAFGKEYGDLNVEEKNQVHANLAERIKQNYATMSRLPRFMKSLSMLPLGDFMAFRVSAIISAMNTTTNASTDFRKGLDKSIPKEQRKAYLEDGLKTSAGMFVAAALNTTFYGTASTVAMMGIKAGLEGIKSLGDEKEDENGKSIGSLSDLYTNFKGTPAINAGWMRGKNNVINSDDGNGNLKVLNISGKDPNDEFFGLILPRKGTSWNETTWGVLTETFSPNMAINLIQAVSKGEDSYGYDLFEKEDPEYIKAQKVISYVLTEAFFPPAAKAVVNETIKDVRSEKGKEINPDMSKKDIKKIEVSSIEFLKNLPPNLPKLLNRTYNVNIVDQLGFYAKDFYVGRDNYDKLDDKAKATRLEQLSRLREGYDYVKKYSIFHNNGNILKNAEKEIKERARGITDTEMEYIKNNPED